MKIYMMRHGQSEGNERGIICGWYDLPLTDKGREQALLARKKVEGVSFDHIFSSPLLRALETARIVAGDRPVAVADGLRERSLGQLEGMAWEEVERRFPDVPVAWPGDPVGYAPPGGESTLEVLHRCGQAVDEIVAGHPGAENILLVSHGAALSCVIAHLLGQQPENAFRYRLDNCTLAVIRLEDGYAMLDRLD